jgi:hypothetical protein
LGLFDDACNSRGHIAVDIRIVNWKWRGRKWPWPNAMSCSNFCLEEIRKASINRSQSGRWWRRGLNARPIENEQANKSNATFTSGINVLILNAEMSTDKRLYFMGNGNGTVHRIVYCGNGTVHRIVYSGKWLGACCLQAQGRLPWRWRQHSNSFHQQMHSLLNIWNVKIYN